MAERSYRPGLYSRFIGYTKIALPLIAIAVLSSVFLLQEKDEIAGGVTFSEDDRDTMRDGLAVYNPRFSGVNLNGDRFFMEAQKATPDGSDTKEVALVDLDGRTDYASGLTVFLKASRGFADLPGQTLDLTDGVRLRTSDGFEGVMNTLKADLETGLIVSEMPVRLTGPRGLLEAGSMRIETIPDENGIENQVFSFENGVTLSFTAN